MTGLDTPPSSTVLVWESRPATLSLDFAGRHLFSATFPARVCVTPIRSLGTSPSDAEALRELANPDVTIAVYYSHPVDRTLLRFRHVDGVVRYVPRHFPRYFADTTTSFETYLAGLSPRTRQTLRRKVRRYCAHVGSDQPWREFSTADELRRFHELARPLSLRTFHDRLLGDGLPATTEYLERLASQGAGARGFLLMDHDMPVAYLFTSVRDDRAVYRYVGYDPAYAEWSPGQVLQYFAMACLCADPAISVLDFTAGEGQHKSTFATHETFCADVYYVRPRALVLAFVAGHAAARSLDRALIGLLDRLRLRTALRRRLRRSTAALP